MVFVLPPLPFDREALAPHMSSETLMYHHGKHHQAYVDKTNELVEAGGFQGGSLVEVIRAAQPGPLRNNAAQVWNHSFFWQCLAPAGLAPRGELEQRLVADFGSVASFIGAFSKEAVAHFGSGWAWLVLQDDKLTITSLHDGDSPVAHPGMIPLFTLDVWEHAYYIDHRNARPRFVEVVMNNLVNWDFIATNLDGNGIARADQA